MFLYCIFHNNFYITQSEMYFKIMKYKNTFKLINSEVQKIIFDYII